MKKIMTAVAVVVSAAALHAAYEAKWESLDKRPVPQWWKDAKFGIFIHWGPYAVPAYAPVADDGKFRWDGYSEWYQGRLIQGNGVFCKHHEKMYGKAPYANFAAEFKAENYDPKEWARLFKRAGAKYVVLTSKHHDGFALWPSPYSPYYNAVAMGPGRDLVREYCDAMSAEGLKRGFYYSMLEYANPRYPAIRDGKTGPAALSIGEWNKAVNFPQLKELAEKYRADIIWPDGEWDYTSSEHGSEKFLAWLYNESPVKDTVVANDRWGKECRGRHGGHYTTEYLLEGGDASGNSDTHPWEECRGIGSSFGFNRYETPTHYMSRKRCVETLVNCVSRGGNLLLNVGPTADGRIPAIMQDRLLAIGRWLEVNGEAIYASSRWTDAPKGLKGIYFTAKGSDIYLISFVGGSKSVSFKAGDVKAVTVLGAPSVKVAWAVKNGVLTVTPPSFASGEMPCEFVPVLRISRK